MNPQPLGQQRLDYRTVVHLDGDCNLLRVYLSLEHEINQGPQALSRMGEAPLPRLLLTVNATNLVGFTPPVNSDSPDALGHLFSVPFVMSLDGEPCRALYWRS